MRLLLLLLCCTGLVARAQNSGPVLAFDNQVQVLANNAALPNAWTPGLNCPQFSTLDVNGDQRPDLFAFDRTTNQVLVYLNEANRYRYAPEWAALFPPDLLYWCLLADYNGDGRKDLFTPTNFGVRVFQNITPTGGRLAWRLAKDPLLTTSLAGGNINLRIDLTDIPAITDIDNDGDLDLLHFTPVVGANIEFNRNLSRERFGHADSLIFEKANARWGNVEECANCNEFAFGNNFCSAGGGRSERTEHAGSTLLALDLNGDNLRDLLVGDVSCNNLVAMQNTGTAREANFTGFNPVFPASRPVALQLFPAAFYEDVDFDGVNDLLVSPNTFFNEGNVMDFSRSVWWYKNTGSNSQPNFQFRQIDFLQDQSIDLGEQTRPAFADVDADGDLDLLVSTAGQRTANNPAAAESIRARVYLYENTGSNAAPRFQLADTDFAALLALNLRFLKISLADLNADGAPDLVFTATANTDNRAALRYLPNVAAPNQRMAFGPPQSLPLAVAVNDEALFYDVDGDRDPDLLLAKFQGALEYYENTGGLNLVMRNAQAGGIANDTDRRGLSLAIGDLDRDSRPDLLTGDRSGRLNFYPNFTVAINGNFTKNDRIIFNSIANTLGTYAFGRDVLPAVLGQAVVLGTAAGGLLYLKPSDAVTATPDEAAPETFRLYPNPNHGQCWLECSSPGTVRVFNAAGQAIYQAPISQAGRHVITLGQQPAGLYIVLWQNAQGQWAKKWLVE